MRITDVKAYPTSFRKRSPAGARRLQQARTITLEPGPKTGGITEALRIAALASAWKLPILEVNEEFLLEHPAIEGPGYL